MVGEIRDPETAQIAIQSALTGHLVFTTVHANNVFDVIGRFYICMLILTVLSPLLTASWLKGWWGCSARGARYLFIMTMLHSELSGLPPEKYRDQVFYEPKGCPECHQAGYRGRTAIAELLELSDEIREMILARKPLSEVRKLAESQGMVPIRQSGLEKLSPE